MSEFIGSLADVYLQEKVPHPASDVDVAIGQCNRSQCETSPKNGMKKMIHIITQLPRENLPPHKSLMKGSNLCFPFNILLKSIRDIATLLIAENYILRGYTFRFRPHVHSCFVF